MTQECKYCGPHCQRGAGHNARVEAGDVYMAQEEKIIPELKPCPFCGHPPHWYNVDGHRERIQCANRNCLITCETDALIDTSSLPGLWNTRAAESAFATQADEMKRLRKMVFAEIDKYQDIFSWQSGEPRNALVCNIRNDIDKRLAALSPQEPQDAEKEGQK